MATVESCHLGVGLFHNSALVHKSLVAQQPVRDCEFVQLNHPAYSRLFPNRKSEVPFRGTWFTDDESLTIAVEAWFESENRKFYFQGKIAEEKS